MKKDHIVLVFRGDGSVAQALGPMARVSASTMAHDISARSTADTKKLPYDTPAVAMKLNAV